MQGSKTDTSDLRRLRIELDRLFSHGLQGPWTALYGQSSFRPPTDVYETEETLCIRVEIAGMKTEDFRVAFIEGALVIAGVRRDPTTKQGYHQMEIGWGPFQTEVTINIPVRADAIEATYSDGFLTVELPKARRRHIPVINRDEE